MRSNWSNRNKEGGANVVSWFSVELSTCIYTREEESEDAEEEMEDEDEDDNEGGDDGVGLNSRHCATVAATAAVGGKGLGMPKQYGQSCSANFLIHF